MIKFPESKSKRKSDKTECSLKAAVNAGMVALGQRYIIEGNPVTCVDIDGNKYIFSMDEVFKCAPHKEISFILKQIYETGKIDDKEVLPVSMMKDIDFLFIPYERQVFGQNKYGDRKKELGIKQFEWYKRGNIVRVKGYRGKDNSYWEDSEICAWWLATVASGNSTHRCYVSDNGHVCNYFASDPDIGVPVFLQITRETEEEPKYEFDF